MQKRFLFLLVINLTASLFCEDKTTLSPEMESNIKIIAQYIKDEKLSSNIVNAANKAYENLHNIFAECVSSAKDRFDVAECAISISDADFDHIFYNSILKISDKKVRNETQKHIEDGFTKYMNNLTKTAEARMNSFK